MQRKELHIIWHKFKEKIYQLQKRQLEVLNHFSHQTEIKRVKEIERKINKLY